MKKWSKIYKNKLTKEEAKKIAKEWKALGYKTKINRPAKKDYYYTLFQRN